jgi:hypothetical protein
LNDPLPLDQLQVLGRDVTVGGMECASDLVATASPVAGEVSMHVRVHEGLVDLLGGGRDDHPLKDRPRIGSHGLESGYLLI